MVTRRWIELRADASEERQSDSVAGDACETKRVKRVEMLNEGRDVVEEKNEEESVCMLEKGKIRSSLNKRMRTSSSSRRRGFRIHPSFTSCSPQPHFAFTSPSASSQMNRYANYPHQTHPAGLVTPSPAKLPRRQPETGRLRVSSLICRLFCTNEWSQSRTLSNDISGHLIGSLPRGNIIVKAAVWAVSPQRF